MKRELSDQLFSQALSLIPGGVNSPVRAFRAVGGQPLFIQRAQGAKIYDVDGNPYIDFVGTWGPSILGHAHPCIIQAVSEQIKSGTSFGAPHPLEVTMAEKIIRFYPSIEKVRLCNSGTEATMSCVRLARGFTGRSLIVKFEGCYHGHVDSLLVKAGSGALTFGQPDSGGVPAELAQLTLTLPFNNPEAFERVIDQYGKKIAAVIVEPIPANAGLYLPKPGYLETLRQLTHENNILLIFDEVMTGFRVAPGGAQEIYRIKPDLTALGKIIGGGLPVGAFGGQSKIMDYLAPLGPVYQAGTLSGNPLALAAGLANIEQLTSSLNFSYEKLEKLGLMLENGIKELSKKIRFSIQFQRIGSMFCIYFCEGPVFNLEDAKRSKLEKFSTFFNGMLERGIYLAPSQFEAGFISIAHTQSEIEKTLLAIEEVFRTL